MSLKGNDIAKRLIQADEQERKAQIQRALTLENAIRSGDVDAIHKAESYYKLQQRQQQQFNGRFTPSIEGMKSIVLDPYEISSSMGYYHKATSITNNVLRGMARTPIPSAIIRTRKNQVSDFTKPQPDKYSNGFVIKKIGAQDEDLKDSDKRKIEQLTNFIINCGDLEHQHDLDDFNTFIRKLVDDALTLDGSAFEIIPSMTFEPDRFAAVDGATIRLADTYDNRDKPGRVKINGHYPKYVQVVDGLIRAEFYPWELCYGSRNPSTNIYANGYGRSELEDLVSTVTNLLNADKYNGSIFRSGSSPKGALMVKKGNINKNSIDQIRRDWNAMLSGAEQNGKTLILDAETVDWVDMQKSNRDMEYGAFYELMVKLSCAVYTISSEEIGFPLQGNKGSGLGSKEGGKEEKDYSRDKGLKPLLTYIQSWVNKYVIGPKTNFQFEFQFAGLEVESAKEEEERLIKAAAVYLTPDEIRAGKKMKPLPNGMGKLPLSPIISQMVTMGQQQEQEQQQAEQEKNDAQFSNTNPFMDQEEEESPFQKSFDEYFEKTYVIE